MSKKKAAAGSPSKARSRNAKAPRATAATPVANDVDELTAPNNARAVANAPNATQAGAPRPPFRRPQSWNFAGVGRNDICPCGSGKRFKNCHGH